MLSKSSGSPQFKSRIEEVNTDNIVCAMPMTKGRPIIVQQGIKFYGRIIIDGVVCFFTSKLLNKKVSPLPVWIIELPFDIQHIQQRSFVRIDAALPVEASITTEENDETTAFETITKDISGGGMQLILNKQIEIGTKLSMTIKLPTEEIIMTNGEVTRSYKPDDDRELFWVSVKFLDINEHSRNKLIKFIFKKQLEQRQRGV